MFVCVVYMFFLGIEGLVLMDEIGTIDKFSEAQIVEEVVDLNYLIDNLIFGIIITDLDTQACTEPSEPP